MEINEKELMIIEEIANNNMPNQRDIAKNTGFSLGLVNFIIKQLIKRGYIKTKYLNKKKIQYMLTPKGFSEKAKKFYNYTVKTINGFKKMKLKMQDFIIKEYKNGQRKFVIYGNSELAELTEISIRDLDKEGIVYIRLNGCKIDLPDEMKDATVLLTEAYKLNNVKGIDVIEILL